MESIFKCLIDYKKPSRIFPVFLEEQLCHFKLKRIREHKPYKLDTPKYFSEMCQEASAK